MTDPIYKILIFMKRRPDLSLEAFRDYYENYHAPLCAQYSKALQRYIRRYVVPQDHPETGPAMEWAFDVITELWFDSKMAFEDTLRHVTTNIMPERVIADEQNLFDRTSFRIATVVECETDLVTPDAT